MSLFSRFAILITVVLALAAFATDSVVVAKETKDSPKQTVAKSTKKVDPAMIKAVQKALVAEGYKLKVDGKLGRQLRAALKKYQKKNKLKVTGRINKATVEKMGIPSPSDT
jgi:peptidoglycan hydrolase-like protein with peptidoglycan-binding domain